MKSQQRVLVVLLALCGLIAGATARAAVIDDFSSLDKSALYNTVLAFDGGWTTPAVPAAYAINASNQFQPFGGWGDTTDWFRNDGYKLNVGDTIGLDIVASNNISSTGLIASQSKTAEVNIGLFAIQYISSWKFCVGTSWIDAPSDFTFNSPTTITLTRASATSGSYDFAYAKSGGGTGHVTGTSSLTAGDYYFGMDLYRAADSDPIADNLSYTAVPEPALMAAGLLGLLACAGRRRQR